MFQTIRYQEMATSLKSSYRCKLQSFDRSQTSLIDGQDTALIHIVIESILKCNGESRNISIRYIYISYIYIRYISAQL